MEKSSGRMMLTNVKLVFHLLITIIAFSSIVLHVIYSPAPFVSITKFTIHSNLIVFLTFLFNSLKRKDTPFLDFLKNCSVIFMSVNILTYHFLLSSGGDYEGIRIITNFTLHYLIPILVFINWIFFETKKKYRFIYIFYWMFYPLLYTIVSLVRGWFDGFYPYFFLNPNGEIPFGVGSYLNVFLFMTAFSILILILGFLLIILNRIFLFFHSKNNPSDTYQATKLP